MESLAYAQLEDMYILLSLKYRLDFRDVRQGGEYFSSDLYTDYMFEAKYFDILRLNKMECQLFLFSRNILVESLKVCS